MPQGREEAQLAAQKAAWRECPTCVQQSAIPVEAQTLGSSEEPFLRSPVGIPAHKNHEL